MADNLNLSDRFAIELTDAQIDILRLSSKVRRRVLSMLRLLQDDLVEEIQRANLEGAVQTSTRLRRAQKLIDNIKATIDGRYAETEKRLKNELRELATLVDDISINIINTVFSVNLVTSTFTQAELKALADRAIILGGPAKEWWKEQSESLRRKFAKQIRMGVLQGESNQQLIQRIRGKATGKTIGIELSDGTIRRVREFANGIMDVGTKEAAALVRTAVQTVSNEVIRQTYSENEDILRGYFPITTLDNRTSPFCIAITGAAWDLKGNPLPESSWQHHMPGWPPFHWLCRTVMGVLVKTWEQLVQEATGKRLKILETVPDSVRASADGLIPTTIRTFDDWLRHMGDTYARKKLGPGLFDLWKSGKITLSQLLDPAGNVRTLTKLKALVD